MSRIFPILIIILSVMVYFFFIDPLIEKTSAQNEEIEHLEFLKGRVEEFGDSLNKRVQKFTSISAQDKERLNHILPKKVKAVPVALEIEELAQRHGLELVGAFDVGDGENLGTGRTLNNAQGFTITNITFTLESSEYDDILPFLTSVSENLRLMDVVSLSFATPEFGEEYTFSISINLYSFDG